MKQPDVFEKMAKDAFDKAEQNAWKSTCWEDETAKLLRAHHQKVCKLVTKQQRYRQGRDQMYLDETNFSEWISAKDLIAALDAMAGRRHDDINTTTAKSSKKRASSQ